MLARAFICVLANYRQLMSILIASLATWQIVEIWHHSSLFASLRSIVEMWENKIGDLLSCPFCLSVWVSLVCIIGLQCENLGLAGLAFSVIIKTFAVARLANLGNDFFKKWTRTPKFELSLESEEDE